MSRERTLEHGSCARNATEKTSFTPNEAIAAARDVGDCEMTETIRRKPYWRQTKLLMLSSLALPTVLTVGLAFWVGRLNTLTLAGMPAGFLLAVHGVALVSIAAVARFAVTQERIERWHGTQDDA